jgi:Phage P2 GpU
MEGIFGAIIFGRSRGRIHTFYEIERKYTGRFGAHMVHLRKPLLEWAGNDLIELSMHVNLNASWCGDPNPILAEWHFFHENAIAAPLIVGGKPMGPGLSLFVVTDMAESHKHWLPGGQLIAVEINISFKEYIPFAEGLLSQFGVPGFVGSGAI